MSLIAHTFLPRSMFDMDLWYRPSSLGFGPSTLDIFDPFDDLDALMSRNLLWLTKPDFLTNFVPRVPNKYRITLDVNGFDPKSIKTEFKDGRKLVVSGSEGKRHDSEDFSIREFRKTYTLPENAETDKLVSFVTSNHTLVIEIPLREQQQNNVKYDLFPRVVDNGNNGKRIEMNLSLPKNIDPSKLSVTCKDRDLIIKAEDKTTSQEANGSSGVSEVYFYKRTTLPENTDFNNLKCTYDDHCLSVSAPLNLDFKQNQRTVPIEFNTKNQQTISNSVQQQQQQHQQSQTHQ